MKDQIRLITYRSTLGVPVVFRLLLVCRRRMVLAVLLHPSFGLVIAGTGATMELTGVG